MLRLVYIGVKMRRGVILGRILHCDWLTNLAGTVSLEVNRRLPSGTFLPVVVDPCANPPCNCRRNSEVGWGNLASSSICLRLLNRMTRKAANGRLQVV